MIRLLFGGVSKIHDVAVGPAAGFRVSGNFIRQLPQNEVIASYHNHQWQLGKDYFSRYDCRDLARVRFEAADGTSTDSFGPFRAILVVDGTMYAEENLFAKFIDETLNWHSYKLETYWPVLVIEAAAS